MKQSLMAVLRLVGLPGRPQPMFILAVALWLPFVVGIALFHDGPQAAALMKEPLVPAFMMTYLLAFSFGVSAPGCFSPGFAWTLPRMRQRLVIGFGILAVIVGVLLATPFLILVGPAPALIAGSTGAFVFLGTSFVSDVRVGRLRWAFLLVLFVGWIPQVLGVLRATPAWLTIAVPSGLAVLIWARAYWPRHAEPRFEGAYDFGGHAPKAPHLALLRHTRSPSRHSIQRSILLNALRAAFHERGFGARRTLAIVAAFALILVATCYLWLDPANAEAAIWPLGILTLGAPVIPVVSFPMSRVMKARFVWSANALNMLVVFAVDAALTALYVVDPLHRWPIGMLGQSGVSFDGKAVFILAMPLLALPVGQWFATRLPLPSPPLIRVFAAMVAVMACTGPLITLAMIGSVVGFDVVLWREGLGLLGIALGVQLISWRSLHRQYASRDLISG